MQVDKPSAGARTVYVNGSSVEVFFKKHGIADADILKIDAGAPPAGGPRWSTGGRRSGAHPRRPPTHNANRARLEVPWELPRFYGGVTEGLATSDQMYHQGVSPGV